MQLFDHKQGCIQSKFHTVRQAWAPKKCLNYSYLNVLKLKIHSLFLITFFCAHVTWWHYFTTLAILVFSLPFSSTQNPQLLPLVSLKSPLNWQKIRNGLLLQNNQTVKQGNFVSYRHDHSYHHSFPFWHIQDNFFVNDSSSVNLF